MTIKYIKNLKYIISFSLIFFLLIICNYLINRHLLHETISNQQTDIVKGVSKRISKWFQQKIDSTEEIRDFLNKMNHKDTTKIKDFLFKSAKVANFRNIYVGYEDDTIISAIKWNKPKNYITTRRPWYKNTIYKNKVTVTSPYMDLGLKEPVVSICAPLKEFASEKLGVVCGVLPLEKIKQEILDISLPYDGFAFIVNFYGKIMLHPDSNKQLKISHFKAKYNNKYSFMDEEELYIFSQNKIKFSNWHVVAQLKKSSVYEKINFQLFVNLIIYAISLFVYLLLTFVYYKSQKYSDENLLKTKSVLREFIEHGDGGVLIIDNEDKIIFENNLFKKYLQIKDIKNNEIDNIFDSLPFDTKKNILKSINDVKTNYKSKEILITLNKEKDEKFILFEIFSVLSKEEVFQGLILSVRDVTEKENEKNEKKEQEDILFQQSKMADLGEMIAAVSHQWRQPLNSLSIMIGNVIHFKKKGKLSDDIFEDNLSYALSNIQYLADTVDTFRNFYKQNKEWQTFYIDNAIEEVSEILKAQFKASGINIVIEKEDYKDCICLNYKNEFQQIIANLFQNAKDAILEKKTALKEIKVHIKFLDNTYYIKISDYGNGIASQIQTKLFQPNQTTKKDIGTGKGLYISRLIARKKLKGDLNIKSFSNPTSFLITIPCNAKDKNVR